MDKKRYDRLLFNAVGLLFDSMDKSQICEKLGIEEDEFRQIGSLQSKPLSLTEFVFKEIIEEAEKLKGYGILNSTGFNTLWNDGDDEFAVEVCKYRNEEENGGYYFVCDSDGYAGSTESLNKDELFSLIRDMSEYNRDIGDTY